MKQLTAKQKIETLTVLRNRFEKNMKRHKGIVWDDVEKKLKLNAQKIWSLNEMEKTGGEPDVIDFNKQTNEFIFCDCSAETPKGRRSICYDKEALNERKEFKPAHSAVEMAKEMEIELLDEEQYRALQQLEKFDTKTSSWIKTPDVIRKLGGALFADFRYNTVFVYHNGAQSYYAARGFRGLLKV